MAITPYYALTLVLVSWALSAQAKEGFYEANRFPRYADVLETSRGATVLFESRGRDGRWTRFANGFFVSADGVLLTNHHVGTSCGGLDPDDRYRDRSQPWEFKSGQGYRCRDFRAVVFPDTARERELELELLARPDQAMLDRGGDFMLLHALDYRPAGYVELAGTEDFPLGTPYFMPGYPPETHRGETSDLIRSGAYSDVARRGEYRVATGKTVRAPSDYLNADHPEPYFVGDGDGAPGTSGSLVITPEGHFLGYVQGGADPISMGESPKCVRDGRQVGPTDRYCGGLVNYLRATWVIDRLTELFPTTMRTLIPR